MKVSKEKVFLAMLPCLVFALIFSLASAEYQDPLPIRYVHTPYGNIILVQGIKVAPGFVNMSFKNSSLCHCRSVCIAYPPCNAFSLVPQQADTLECQLTTNDLRSVSYSNDTSPYTVYGYKEAAIKGKLNRVMEDGFLYYVPQEKMHKTAAEKWCRNIPGFRLGIFKKKEELQVLVKIATLIGGALSLDLKNNMGHKWWGDDTPLDLNAVAAVGITDIPDRSNNHSPYGVTKISNGVKIFGRFGNSFPICQAITRKVMVPVT